MSEKKPRGSAQLEGLFVLIKKIELQAINSVSGRVNTFQAALEECSQELTASMDPDRLKVVIDKIELTAERWLVEAEKISDIANALDLASHTIRSQFQEAMKTLGKEELKGAAWTARIKKMPPKISIDWEVLKKDGEKYKRMMPLFDEAAILADIEKGETVPGIIAEDVFVLDLMVEKAVQQ